jgi:hypothetical protein
MYIAAPPTKCSPGDGFTTRQRKIRLVNPSAEARDALDGTANKLQAHPSRLNDPARASQGRIGPIGRFFSNNSLEEHTRKEDE